MAEDSITDNAGSIADSTVGEAIIFMGKWFAGLIEPLLEFIRVDAVGPGLALMVVMAAIVVLVALVIFAAKDEFLIRKAHNILKQYQGEADDSDPLEVFAYNYKDINDELGEISKIQKPWKEFNETLIPPTNEHLVCSNTVRPHEYFNLNDLDVGPRFMKVWPNIFVGTGLALTFFGLISALDAATAAINAPTANNATAISTAIQQLLAAASAKFYASLFALISSIILTLALRSVSGRIGRKIRGLNEQIEQGVEYISSESIAQKTKDIQVKQLTQLETFNTDLAIKIGNQIQVSLNPIINKIEKMGDGVGEAQLETIRQIGTEITTQIGTATGESMTAVATKLDEVSDKLGGLTDSLTGALSNFDGEFKAILQGLHNSLEESTQKVASGLSDSLSAMTTEIGQTTQTITATVGGLQTTVENLAGVSQEITEKGGEAIVQSVEAAAEAASGIISTAGQEMAEGFRTSTAGMTTSFEEAAGVAKESITNAGQEMADGFQVSTTHMTTSFEEAAQAASGIISTAGQEVAEGFRTSTTDMSTAAERASEKISDAGAAMAEKFKTAADQMIPALNTTVGQLQALQTGFASLPARLEEINESLAAGAGDLIRASQQFSTASGNLKELVEPLATYAEETRTAITNTTETFVKVAESTDSSSSRIASAVDKLHTEVSNQVQRLDGSDETLGRLMEELQNHTAALLARISNFTTEVDLGFRQSIGLLSESIEQFEDAIDGFRSEDNPPEE